MLIWRRLTRTQAGAAVLTGAALGIAVGAGLASGQVVAVVGILPVFGALSLLVRVFVSREDRRLVLQVIALAFAVRIGAAALVYVASLALGKDGYTSGDDRAYADVAWYVAQYWRGTPVDGFIPPEWNGYAYLLGTYTYLEAVVFYGFGFQLMLMCFVNAAFGAATLIPVWLIVKAAFGLRSAQAAVLLVALLPSLIVFSAVNLKDALNTLLVALVLLAVLRFQISPGALALACAFAALEPIRGIRNHIFVGLAGLLPISIGLAPALSLRTRTGWMALTGALSVLILVANSIVTGGQILPSQLLQEMERFRTALAVGRTAIEEAKRPAPTATPSDRPTQASLVPSHTTSPAPTATPSDRPTHASLVPSHTTSPVGSAARPNPTPSIVSQPGDDRDSEIISGTLAYFPIGLAYALGAPFPWKAERLVDLASIPDTLAWYGILAGMMWTAWRLRARWNYFAPSLLFVVGLLVLFALVEGNVGTLLRHRALFMPFAIIVASPAIASLASLRARTVPLSPALTRRKSP